MQHILKVYIFDTCKTALVGPLVMCFHPTTYIHTRTHAHIYIARFLTYFEIRYELLKVETHILFQPFNCKLEMGCFNCVHFS